MTSFKNIKLDLHGVKHREVNDKVIRIIEDNWNVPTEIEIITGNSDKMKDIVKNILNEYKLPYKINSFFNSGVIKTYT